MSTAEITFSIGELAAERKQEAHKIFWALMAALLIHLVVGYVLAIVESAQPTPIVEEDKPMEMTIVDTSPVVPAVPKNPPFIETDESRQSKEAPKEKTFESNANSIAASEAPPTGEAPLPSQEGKDRPGLDLQNQQYTLANQGAPAQAAVPPRQNASPSQSSTPAPTASPMQMSSPEPTAAPDQFAMLTKRPTPPPQPDTTTPPPRPQTSVPPQPPSSAYRPQRQQTRVSGSISNRGISAVNALGTPLGRYQKIVTDSIGSRWYAYTSSKLDLITIGTLRAHFVVDRNGKIKDLRILGNTSNETFANICLQSILDANLPPIPDDVAASLPPEGMEWDGVNFTMYPN